MLDFLIIFPFQIALIDLSGFPVGENIVNLCLAGNVDQLKLSKYNISLERMEKTEDECFCLDAADLIRDALYSFDSEVRFIEFSCCSKIPYFKCTFSK